MRDDPESWRARVRQAAVNDDQATLRVLFAEAVEIFGDDASTEWARALSALDGTAITG